MEDDDDDGYFDVVYKMGCLGAGEDLRHTACVFAV